MGIKTEPLDEIHEPDQIEKNTDSKSQVETLLQEKNNLIETIVSLKSENHQMCYQLNETNAELAALKIQYGKKEQNIAELNAKLSMIVSDLKGVENNAAKLQIEFNNKHQIDQKVIHSLNAEKKILTARMKQLESGALLNYSMNKKEKSNDENVFVVDQLIDDKMIGKILHYRVRWQGYGSDDDTWEKADNLSCPTILREYLKSKPKKK